jgi:CRP/FNR family cyclic AMP-dependent transcriptional regulator
MDPPASNSTPERLRRFYLPAASFDGGTAVRHNILASNFSQEASMADSDVLSRIHLFRNLPDEQLQALVGASERMLFQAGEIVFRQGDPADWLYVVEEGNVDIVIPSEGEEIVLASFGAGSFFGELGLFDQQPRNATARASEGAKLVGVPVGAVTSLIDGHPAAARHFLRVVAQRLRAADKMLSRLQIRNPNKEMDEQLTIGQRIADAVSRFGGSWAFIILFFFLLLAWAVVNTTWILRHPPDPYPFIFLNLMLSMLAAIQAPIIMMSQNRQSMHDRLQADLDYEVNVKAELAIRQLHRKVDELRALVLQ